MQDLLFLYIYLEENRGKNHKHKRKMELWSVVFVWCVLCFGFLHTEAIVKLRGNETIPALILFGDSIVDTGANNNLITAFKSNFPPYGRDFHGAQPTGRFSNGKVPSDFVGNYHSRNAFTFLLLLLIRKLKKKIFVVLTWV